MPPVDHRALAIESLFKKILASTFNRQLAEQFIAECAKLIKLQSALLPNQILERCVQERGKKLAAMNRAGWARNPQQPDKFILVDPKGCVIVDFDGKEISPPAGTILTSRSPSSSSSIKASYGPMVTRWEGRISFIYLDSNNKATVGVGHHIRDESEAVNIHRRFPFVYRDPRSSGGAKRANDLEVRDEYRRIMATKAGGKGAEHFRNLTSLDLTANGIDRLLDRDIDDHLGDILRNTGRFPNYLTYPLDAQLAILDRVFNRGLPKILGANPFMEAIQRRDWTSAIQAVNHSLVAAPDPNRQSQMKQYFQNAARQEPYFVDPKCPRKAIVDIRV